MSPLYIVLRFLTFTFDKRTYDIELLQTCVVCMHICNYVVSKPVKSELSSS